MLFLKFIREAEGEGSCIDRWDGEEGAYRGANSFADPFVDFVEDPWLLAMLFVVEEEKEMWMSSD
jgi:hypothetical protein